MQAMTDRLMKCRRGWRHGVATSHAATVIGAVAADGGGLFEWQSWSFLRRHTARATDENNQGGGLRRAVLETWETNARPSSGSVSSVVPGMAVCWIYRFFSK